MAKQVDAIHGALGDAVARDFNVEVCAALCFVSAEWSLFAKPFNVGGVWIGWLKALGDQLRVQGQLAPEHLLALARQVADALPAA